MNDDQLDARLADIAREDGALEAPAHVEGRTLDAWDEWRSKQAAGAPRAAVGRRWVAGALAALAASGLVAMALPRPLDPVPPPVPAPVAPMIADVTEIQAATIDRMTAGPVPERPVIERRLPAPQRRSEGAVESARFIQLGPDLEYGLPGSFQLARVRVPRDVLVDLGLLIDAHRGGEPVQADVVFGEDGLAKAIRLAPVSRRMP